MAGVKQLINQFNPDSYKLELDLNKQDKTFSGKLHISGYRRSRPSYRITLNQNGLRVTSAKLFKKENGKKDEIPISRIVHHYKLQELRIHTDQQIVSGKYDIELEYYGKVSTKGTNGFYTSHWNNGQQQEEILTTQFETHYARQMLPCIDEPEAKAIFSLSLKLVGSSKNDVILFNTPPAREEIINEDGSRTVVFAPTPPMSSYLLALIIGRLEGLSRQANNTKISIYSTPNKVKSAKFALEFAIKVLELLEDKFKIQYPLSKLDLVAVPDFDAGGMENWGLITFREDLLLFDEANSTLLDKQAIALVIAHEVAHQWFGNLVTMKWWDELWLNEGFANFMECYIVDKIYPEWRMLENYLITDKSYAIRLDSLPSSRPVVSRIKHAHQVVDSFDAVAYEKSGSVIRMIHSLIGEEAFMLGLGDYFRKFKYSSATSRDLLDCWQKFTKVNLFAFCRSWLYEAGVPKVEILMGKKSGQLVVKQSRFLSEKKSKSIPHPSQLDILKTKPNTKKKQREFYFNLINNQLQKDKLPSSEPVWQIPIEFVWGGKKSDELGFLLKKRSHTIQLSKNHPLPLKINRGGGAFYVTSYPLELLAPLSMALKNKVLSSDDSLNLLSDVISLNKAVQFSPGAGAVLDLIKSGKESMSSAQFWSLTGGYIGFIDYHLRYESKSGLLHQYISGLISDALKNIKFEISKNDDPNTITTRFELISLASLAADKTYSPKLLKIYDNSQGGIRFIEPEKRLPILYLIAKRGKKDDYYTLLKEYESNLEDVALKDDLAYGLCMFEKEQYVVNNLKIMQDTNLVRDQDILAWLSQIISSSRSGAILTINWVIKEGGWQWLKDNLSTFDCSGAVKIITSSAFTKVDLNRLRKFFIAQDDLDISKAIEESVAVARSRIEWHKKELPALLAYLQ